MSPPFSSLSLPLTFRSHHTSKTPTPRSPSDSTPPRHPSQDGSLRKHHSSRLTRYRPKRLGLKPRPRSRAIKNVGTATTDDDPWSKKIRLLDTPQICYHQRALAKVVKWLSGPAFDMPPPNPPFSDNKEQHILKNRLPVPKFPSTRLEHGHNDTGKRAPEGIANYAMITLAFFAFLPITNVVTMATTIVLIIYLPCLIKKAPVGAEEMGKASENEGVR